MLVLLGGLLGASIGFCVAWQRARKREVPIHERLVPVPGAGYSLDPKAGEFVCPRCLVEGHCSYLMELDGGGALYCQACKHGVSRKRRNEEVVREKKGKRG
jgi:hypothetical protein